jgi:excisionase family DNA binding protein
MSITSTGIGKQKKKKGRRVRLVTGAGRRLATNVDDACYQLDVGRDRLYDLLKRGEIESYLDGQSRKIVVSSMEEYVAKKRENSKEFRAREPNGVA